MNPAFYDIKEKNGKRKIEVLKCVVQFVQTPKDVIHNRRRDIDRHEAGVCQHSLGVLVVSFDSLFTSTTDMVKY